MFFEFGLKSSFLLVFFFHGVVFSILLFVKGRQYDDKPGSWLSLFTLLCALYIAPFMLGYAGWYSKMPYREILFYIPFQQLFLLPPVLYFYCRSLFDRSFVFTRSDLVHFIPAMLYGVYSLLVFVVDKVFPGDIYFYKDGRDKDFSFWYQLAGFLSLGFYLIKSLRLYTRYRRLVYNTVSFADSLTFAWAQRFIIACLFLLAIRGTFFVLNPEWAQFGRKFWYYLLFSGLFYYISLSGYINSIRSVTTFDDSAELPKTSEEENLLPGLTLTEEENQTQPGEKIDIPDLDLWKIKIEQLMLDDKIYEDPELSIAHLAGQLDTHTKKISQVINQGFEMNFNDFVNYHRVKAIIKKMDAGEHSIQTLLSLAFECGFNSKSTFNRAFKRHTSVTPIAYIQKYSNN